MPPKRTPASSPQRRRPPADRPPRHLADAGRKLNEPLLPPPVSPQQRTSTPGLKALSRPGTLSGTRTPPFALDHPKGSTSTPPVASLPLWWLIFVTLYYLPVILSWQLLGSIMLPAAVAEIVPVSERNMRLGVAAAVGSAMQFAQPFVGAMSDHFSGCGALLGRRRPFIIAGQLMSCAGCAILMKCRALGYVAAATGYTLYVLGNAVGYGVYPSLIANHIPDHQRGTASGLQGAMSLVGYLGAAGLGVVAGNANQAVLHRHDSSDSGSGSHTTDDALGSNRTNELIYALLIALNFGCLVVAVISFGERPSLCLTPEAQTQHQSPLDPPAKTSMHLTLSPVPPAPTCSESAQGFFSAFRHRSFSVLFVSYVFASMGQFTSMTYCEYYFHDMIAPRFVVLGVSLTKDAEAAVGIWSFVQSLVAFFVAVPAGVISDTVGRKLLLGVSFLISGCSFIPFALPNVKFDALMLMSAVGGVGMGINQGVMMALFADVLPSKETAARDINLMVSSMTISQTIVSYAGGTLLSWLNQHGTDTMHAYSVIWLGTAAVTCLGAPLLLCVGNAENNRDGQLQNNNMSTDRRRAMSVPDLHSQQTLPYLARASDYVGNGAELDSPGKWSDLMDVSAGDADFADEIEAEIAAVAAVGPAGSGTFGLLPDDSSRVQTSPRHGRETLGVGDL